MGMDLSATQIDILFVVGGFVAGLLVMGLVCMARIMWLDRDRARLSAQITASEQALKITQETMDARFKATAQEALSKSSEDFLRLAQERLKQAQNDGAHDLDKRQLAIKDMVEPIQKRLTELGSAIEQAKGTDQALREDLKYLSQETAKLVGALRDPAAQGKWGEYILERLLEKSGFIEGIHYETQVTLQGGQGTQRPDVVINLNDGFHIVVDAKAPINEYAQRISENLNDDEYNSIATNRTKQIRSHVQQLSRKGYWGNLEGVDFTVLFLPSENLYSAALRTDPNLANFAFDKNIIIASPTLFMSLLRVVGMSWKQVELAQNAKDISALGSELYDRIATFSDHMDKVGTNLGRANDSYNKAVSSLESRVLVSARKFQDLHAAPQGKKLDTMEPSDAPLRILNMSGTHTTP